MNNVKKLKRIKDILTMPASNSNEAIAIAIEFLCACDKKNLEAKEANEKKTGLYTVKVSYDVEYNNEEDYKYTYKI